MLNMKHQLENLQRALLVTYTQGSGHGFVRINDDVVDVQDAMALNDEGNKISLGTLMVARALPLSRLLFGNSFAVARVKSSGNSGVITDDESKCIAMPAPSIQGAPPISCWLVANRAWQGVTQHSLADHKLNKEPGVPDISDYYNAFSGLIKSMPKGASVDCDLLTPAIVGEVLENKIPAGVIAATLMQASVSFNGLSEDASEEAIKKTVARMNEPVGTLNEQRAAS